MTEYPRVRASTICIRCEGMKEAGWMSWRQDEPLSKVLCRLCNKCGSFYFWCDDFDHGWREATFEEARVEAAKLLLRLRYADVPRFGKSREDIQRSLHEVFVMPIEGAFDAPELPRR